MLKKVNIKPINFNEDATPSDLFELRFYPENLVMTENVIDMSQSNKHINVTFLDTMVDDVLPLYNKVNTWPFKSIELIECDRMGNVTAKTKWNVHLDDIVRTTHAYNPSPQFIAVFTKGKEDKNVE